MKKKVTRCNPVDRKSLGKSMMFKAIEVKYISPSNTRGSRLSAKAIDNKAMLLPWYDDLGTSENFELAALTYAEKKNWKGSLVGGVAPNGNHVFVFCERKFK